jgi:hypothetical protein
MGGMNRLDWFLTRCLFFLICLVAVCALIPGPVCRRLVATSYAGGPFLGRNYSLTLTDDPDRRYAVQLMSLSAHRVTLPNGRPGSAFYLRIGAGNSKNVWGFLCEGQGPLRPFRPGEPAAAPLP